MIIFYNTTTGLCIRSANGIASDVEIVNNQASNGDGLLITDMTNVAYADVPDQNIYNGDVPPTPKLFSSLKQGVPIEVRLAVAESALLFLMEV